MEIYQESFFVSGKTQKKNLGRTTCWVSPAAWGWDRPYEDPTKGTGEGIPTFPRPKEPNEIA